MKNQSLVTCSALLSLSAVAFADPVADFLRRCETDSLAPAQAVERTEWWIHCRLPEVKTIANTLAGEVLSDADAAAQIRSTYLYTRSGTLRPRPMYPTFVTKSEDGKIVIVVAPIDRNAACDAIPANALGDIACTSSCYKPDVQVLFKDGYTDILNAFEQKLPMVSVVAGSSTRENIKLKNKNVANYTESVVDSVHQIKVLKMKSGGVLRVTENHPLVNQEGRLVEAGNLKKGDYLLGADGKADEITVASEDSYFGKVYNVSPKSKNLLENLVIAEGYLSGSSWYQNDGVLNVNRILLRSSIPNVYLK